MGYPDNTFYNLMGSRDPGTTSVYPTASVLGMIFRITSSTVLLPDWTGSVSEVRVYRDPTYKGPYTGSLWASSSGVLLGSCYFDSGSGTGWLSQSITTPTLSLDTDYIVAYYSFFRNRTSSSFVSQPWRSGSVVFNPLYVPQNGGIYVYTGSIANPAGLSFPTIRTTTWYGVDVTVSGSKVDYPVQRESLGLPNYGSPGVNGYLQGINLGHGSLDGQTPLGRYYQVGVTQSMSEGVSSAPSLCLQIPGMWRFRWEVKNGTRKISVMSKQTVSLTGYTPTLTVKSNPSIGLLSDVSASAAVSVNWTTIGPITITPTVSGVVWVELRNNDTYNFLSPAYFDNITAS